jgi:UDP-N-acetylmuramyl pentapeptide synthase
MNNFFKKIVQFILKWFAKIYLWRIKPHIIVIAGTTGRHWIKETVREALEEKNFPVRVNKKNFNAEIGLPLSILNLASGEGNFWRWLDILWQAAKKAFCSNPPVLKEFLVLEMAVDRPDNMNYLLSIVKPKAAVFTSVTMIYQENFENLDEIANEYKKLIKALPWNGLTILNFDDERVKNLAKFSRNRVITYGFNEGADFRVKNFKKVSDGQELKLQINHPKKIVAVKINRFGTHHIYAALVKEVIRENYKMPTSDFFSLISIKP